MRSLIIFAHGSRRDESNKEVALLASKVSQKPDCNFDEVSFAFLELAKPDALMAINRLVEKGSNDITILPYFLNSGSHVKQDIPELLAQARQRYPDCKFTLAAAIGMYEGMPDLILQSSKQLEA